MMLNDGFSDNSDDQMPSSAFDDDLPALIKDDTFEMEEPQDSTDATADLKGSVDIRGSTMAHLETGLA